ncbi:MAG: diguanylate cyclase, partial [Firmicutes bacterium]|nr:diguanylate cyclase [Bacillota bacterium]
GGTLRFEYHSKKLNRDYDITAYGIEELHFALIIQDTTARKRKTYKRSHMPAGEKRIDAILSETPGVFYTCEMIDGKKVFTYVNNNVVNVLGFRPEEIIGAPEFWSSRIHPEDVVQLKAVQENVENDQPLHLEYRFKSKTGEYCWLHEVHKVVTNISGEKTTYAVCWDITEHKHAKQLIEARVKLLSFSYGRPMGEVLQRALDKLCKTVSSPLGFYHFVSDDEKIVTVKTWSLDVVECYLGGDNLRMRFNVAAAGVWADCLRERRPVIYNQYTSLPHRKGLPEGHPAITRLLIVPVMWQDKIVAVVGVANKLQDYTEQDAKAVSYLADVAWTIASRKQSEAKIRYLTFHDKLTGLYNRAFMEEEINRLNSKRQMPVSVIVADVNGLKLVNDTYGHGVGDKMLKAVAGILKRSCRQEDIIARWGGDEFVILLPQTPLAKAREIGKRIMEKCIAVYIEDVPIALAVGVAVKKDQNSDLTDALKRAEDSMYKQKLLDSKSTKSAVLNALLKTLRAKSFETEEHACRMQMIALEFGEKLGLPDSELNRLSLLITLHDIGKINIPEGILTKAEPLTEEEWEIMKKHPETGFRITRSTEEFAHVAEDIFSHHEHWDGSGYPRGLKGEKIPFLARITAIIDAYEVMTNGRPYKKKLSKEEAVAEIIKHSGTHFDPELAKLFVKKIVENR